MNPIQSLQSSLSPPELSAGAASAPAGGKSFTDHLLDSIREVNSMQQSADQAVTQMMTGGDASPAEVLTAVQKADIAFRMMMQIRNKLMSAYSEIKDIKV
jgi:flagellar hook-basal body complex protein FliE